MNQKFWLIIVFIVTVMVCNGSCRPQNGASTFTVPFKKKTVDLVESETSNSFIESTTAEIEKLRLKDEENGNTPKETKLNIESIANVARASSDGPSLPSSAYGQLFDTLGQMVDSDIRTPPKLSQFIKEKHTERKDTAGDTFKSMPVTFIYEDDSTPRHEVTERIVLEDASEGKAIRSEEGVQGVAIPVLMDDVDYDLTAPSKKLQKITGIPKPIKDERKKTGVTKFHQTTTPSSKLSTWILLSDNKEITTPLPKKNNNKKTNGNDDNDAKKKTGGNGSTTKKPAKITVTTLKAPSGSAQKKVTVKPMTSTTRKPEPNTGATSGLEALLKTQKKNSISTSKPKNGVQKKPANDPTKKFEEKIDVAEVKDEHDEMEPQETKTTYTIPTKLMLTTENGISVTEPSSSTSLEKTSQETTKKKKSSSKKKKKNKNKKKKTETGVEMKTPDQPVGSQIYNFLSREIVPTVGLGLIGVALTAGLASFLGYNPFATATVPLRRTYETNHGYSPSLTYDYNANYGDGGQSEEVLFREVLSGMPEGSRYDLTRSDSTYQDTYSRQDQTYPTASGAIYSSEKKKGTYNPTYSQDYSYGLTYNEGDKNYSTENQEKYPVYTRETGTSFVYPETTGMTAAEKTTGLSDDTQETQSSKYGIGKVDTIERHPEALYRVASESDLQYRSGSTIHGINSQSNWHRVGKPMESIRYYSHVEPGPRSLDLSRDSKKSDQVKKRSKRGTDSVIQRIARKRTKKENDEENEIDFDESFNDQKTEEISFNDIPFTTVSPKTTTFYKETKTSTTEETTERSTTGHDKEKQTSTTTEETKDSESSESYETIESDISTTTGSNAVSVIDVLKRLAQFKLRLGLSFLRSTTDMFSRYLDDIQRRVDESFTNTTTTTVHYNKRRNIWSRIFNRGRGEGGKHDDEYSRKKRSALTDNQYLSSLIAEEEKRNSKSTKKDLKFSTKIFLQKKKVPKKYESNTRN